MLSEAINTDLGDLTNFKLDKRDTYNIVNFTHKSKNFKLHINSKNSIIYMDSENIDTTLINIDLYRMNVINSRTIKKVIDDNIVVKKDSNNVNDEDYYGIMIDYNNYDKSNVNYSELENILANNNNSLCSSKNVPNNVLFNKRQVVEIIIDEIRSVNTDKKHKHFIDFDEKHPYLFYVNFVFDDLVFVMSFEYDSFLTPYYPPKIGIISSNIDDELRFNLMNLELFKVSNWNPIINLQWIVENLGMQLEQIIQDHLEDKNTDVLEKLLIHLSVLNKTNDYSSLVKLDFNRFSLTETSSNSNSKSYWKAGTGYSHNGTSTSWDINDYIRSHEVELGELESVLKQINEEITTSPNYNNRYLLKYITGVIHSASILEIQQSKGFYSIVNDLVFNICERMKNDKDIDMEWIENLNESYGKVNINIAPILNKVNDSNFDRFNNIYNYLNEVIKENKVVNESKETETIEMATSQDNYKQLVSSEQNKLYSGYEIKSDHRFYKSTKNSMSKNTLMRVCGELGNLGDNLPNNWDTSVIFRASENNLNVFSFVVIGPKDTPYHNGIFEFHGSFPQDYPNSPPNVLINTTGSGKVRFNPNLYANGKVCLSLLNTWESDSRNEHWNPKTSTLLQVLVSIQSLIFIEQPYFNEPGYESRMGTQRGDDYSFKYNDETRRNNMKVAILGNLKSPPYGFEEFTRNHFRLKKDEIIETCQKWIDESKSYKNEMKRYLDEFINLMK